MSLKRHIIDWLDDHYHFGDAATLIRDDEMSFLQNGVLDSLGFVQLVLFLENSLGLKVDRATLSPANFDGLGKIIRYLEAHPQYRGVPA